MRGGSSVSNMAAGFSMLATMARLSSRGLRKPISRRRRSALNSSASILKPPLALTSAISAAAASTGCAATSAGFSPVTTRRLTTPVSLDAKADQLVP